MEAYFMKAALNKERESILVPVTDDLFSREWLELCSPIAIHDALDEEDIPRNFSDDQQEAFYDIMSKLMEQETASELIEKFFVRGIRIYAQQALRDKEPGKKGTKTRIKGRVRSRT